MPIVGTTLQIVGEELCEALDLRAGQSVLDVAAGNGNISLAAARRWGKVVSTDYVPALLERGRERAAAERLDIEFRQADAEALPFADASFDVVVSTFGVMFTPDQDRAAAELIRVVQARRQDRPRELDARGLHRPGLQDDRQASAAAGRGQIARALGDRGAHQRILRRRRPPSIKIQPRAFAFRYHSAQHWLEVFKTYYGPLLKAFAALEPRAQAALAEDLLALIGRFNRSGDESMVVPSDYLEIVVTRR